jgi:cobalt-zinc-cadmium efflux system outer membrane protein
MGLRKDRSRLGAVSTPAEEPAVPEWEMLVETAMSSRPDLRAAEIAIQAAAQRARWERSRILALVGPILSIKEVGTYGVRVGPGVYADIPVFQRNQGGIARADAEVERATLMYLALLERIELEVREARLQLLQARESAARTRSEILPGVLDTVRLAERAYSNGDAPYLFVLEAGRKVFDVRSGEAEALAAVRRARAQLERSVGRRL